MFWKTDDKMIDFLYVGWFNLVKVCKMKTREDGKQQMEVLQK